MSGVLHPVGPEEPGTYWVRRAVVVGAALLALILLIVLIASQNSSGSVVGQPSPSAAAPTTAVSGPPPFTPSPTPTEPGSSSSAEAGESPSGSPSPAPTGSAESEASPSPTPRSPKPRSTAPTGCAAKDLRPTLTGDQRLAPEEKDTFAISLINGSGSTCVLKVDQGNFELKIYSGTDRIWSTADCSTAVTAMTRKLAKEQALEWKLTWDGRRSREDCKRRPEIPKAGTYFATAQYEGAEPVQLRMIIRG